MASKRVILVAAAALVLFCISAAQSVVAGKSQGAPPGSALMAIVIDDLAGGKQGTEAMLAIDRPLTMAIFPFEEQSEELAAKAVAQGFELIIHLPMEAHRAKPHWYPKGTIRTRQSPAEIQAIVTEAFAKVPAAKGLNNHMGSKATEDKAVIRAVLEVVQSQDKFVLDSRTSFKTVIKPIARELGVPVLQRNVFLDEVNTVGHVKKQLRKLAKIAQKQGYAIGIGHVGPTGPATAQAIREMIPELEAQGITIVPLSDLLNLPAATR